MKRDPHSNTKPAFLFLAALALAGAPDGQCGPNDSNWVQAFNGVDLADWKPKFELEPFGVNQNNVFQVKNGMLDVVIEKAYTQTAPRSTFGHLYYYKRKFSHYLLRAQYRFLATTSAFSAAQGDWTIQNNGLMLVADTMQLADRFPPNFEFQLLGPRSPAIGATAITANVCATAPVSVASLPSGAVFSEHCIAAKRHSLQYMEPVGNGRWIYVQAKVLSDSLVVHYVRSRADTAWDSVFSYIRLKRNGEPAKEGYFTIQAEGTSAEFAKIEVLDLVGCTNPAYTSYRAYFVKSDPAQCNNTVDVSPLPAAPALFRLAGSRVSAAAGILAVEIFDVRGARVAQVSGRGARELDIPRLDPGLYSLRVATRKGTSRAWYPVVGNAARPR